MDISDEYPGVNKWGYQPGHILPVHEEDLHSLFSDFISGTCHRVFGWDQYGSDMDHEFRQSHVQIDLNVW